MKILVCSSSGPISDPKNHQISLRLTKMMRERDHDVTLVTDTPLPTGNSYEYQVVENPSRKQLSTLFNEADAVFGNHLSFRLLRPLIFSLRKPHCVLIQAELEKTFSRLIFRSSLFNTRKVYAISSYLAGKYQLSSRIIHNSFDPEIYYLDDARNRKFDFLFVGTLNRESGSDMVVDAMRLIPKGCNCAIVGEGPEREKLEEELPANTQIFPPMEAQFVAELMRQSKWLILPDRNKNPDGILAVQAIACGARIIAANHGCFPELVGPCGLFFRPNHLESLLMIMRKAIEREDVLGFTEQERQQHLSKFSWDLQVDSILQVLHR